MSKRVFPAATHQPTPDATAARLDPCGRRAREPIEESPSEASHKLRIGDLAPYEFASVTASVVQPATSSSAGLHRPIRLLRLPQVTELVGLRRSAIYELQAEGRFPRRVKLGARAVGWIEEEVQAWLAQRVAQNDFPPALKRRLDKTGGGTTT